MCSHNIDNGETHKGLLVFLSLYLEYVVVTTSAEDLGKVNKIIDCGLVLSNKF